MGNRTLILLTALLPSLMGPSVARAENSKYPPLADYLMPRAAEVALARSAAPLHISGTGNDQGVDRVGVRGGSRRRQRFCLHGHARVDRADLTPAPLRELVYDAAVRAPICFDPWRRAP